MPEKAKLFQYLISMLSKVVPGKYVKYVPQLIMGDAYTFLKEDSDSFLRDGSEFSTAMNACGRNRQEKVAMEVLKGDRLVALDELESVSLEHRRNLAQAIAKVAEGDETNIIEMENLQYFDGTGIKPEIVGTIAGMILGYCNWKKPVIGFAQTDEEGLKISLRCSRLLSYDGIHFGHIIRKISSEVGGSGSQSGMMLVCSGKCLLQRQLQTGQIQCAARLGVSMHFPCVGVFAAGCHRCGVFQKAVFQLFLGGVLQPTHHTLFRGNAKVVFLTQVFCDEAL